MDILWQSPIFLMLTASLPIILIGYYYSPGSFNNAMEDRFKKQLLVAIPSFGYCLAITLVLGAMLLGLAQPKNFELVSSSRCHHILMDATASVDLIGPQGISSWQKSLLWVSSHMLPKFKSQDQASLWLWADQAYLLTPLTLDVNFINSATSIFSGALTFTDQQAAAASLEKVVSQLPSASCASHDLYLLSDGIHPLGLQELTLWLSQSNLSQTNIRLNLVDTGWHPKHSTQLKQLSSLPSVYYLTADQSIHLDQNIVVTSDWQNHHTKPVIWTAFWVQFLLIGLIIGWVVLAP